MYTAKDVTGHYSFTAEGIYVVDGWEISDPTIESELNISIDSNGNTLPDGVRGFLWAGRSLGGQEGVLITINPAAPHGWQYDDESQAQSFFAVLLLDEDSGLSDE